INGLSKGFAMTGYRLGYIAAAPEIIKACEKLQGQFTSGACAVTQRAAITALTASLDTTLDMLREFTARKKRVIELLSAIPGLKLSEPDGAFYVFPDVSSYFGKKDGDVLIANADDLCMHLLNKAHVSTVTGRAFGEPNCIRLSFANSMAKIEGGLQRITDAMKKLK
ncbi:MAG TPA: aminotransferase class I/II-fold pyridoxal phosphate-dependent enzyme, partial [Flavitalea sp.]|nr:aminotransferase class I/II-fold pyridoxal phosphate-dependent enzyme [Flavitalea sp.]